MKTIKITILSLMLFAPIVSRSEGSDDITAVSSRVSSDYHRKRQSNGKYKTETYAFGNGGNWSGSKADFSIDKMSFLEVAHMIAPPLASQQFIPSNDAKSVSLLIMVYWGTTHAPEHANTSDAYVNMQSAQSQLSSVQMMSGAAKPVYNVGQTQRVANGPAEERVREAEDQLSMAMSAVAAENALRDQDDQLNVMMLGYDSWWVDTDRFKGTTQDYRRQDLLNEIENDRYFVVLMAYDFQLLWKERKHKLLWETRFSVRQMHHEFNKDLPAMAKYASQFFGQDSHGLIHDSVPFGHVDIGELKSLGEADPK